MRSSYPTPMYSHAGRGQFKEVYEPAEDSFLFIDALEQDAEELRKLRWPAHVWLAHGADKGPGAINSSLGYNGMGKANSSGGFTGETECILVYAYGRQFFSLLMELWSPLDIRSPGTSQVDTVVAMVQTKPGEAAFSFKCSTTHLEPTSNTILLN